MNKKFLSSVFLSIMNTKWTLSNCTEYCILDRFCIAYKNAIKSTTSLNEPGHNIHTFPTKPNHFYAKDYLGAFNGMIKIEKKTFSSNVLNVKNNLRKCLSDNNMNSIFFFVDENIINIPSN